MEDLFTVTGRSDAGGCSLSQPNFAAVSGSERSHLPHPHATFGVGLIENLDDSTLLKKQAANLSNNFGISGTFNHSGNDGTIARFGWKAQNKSLHMFAGEANNVEMGVTNSLFPNERPSPEDEPAMLGLPVKLPGPYRNRLSGKHLQSNFRRRMQQFSTMCRHLPISCASWLRHRRSSCAKRMPGPRQFDLRRQCSLFSSIGCATCHNPSPARRKSSNFVPALSNVPVTGLLGSRAASHGHGLGG